MAMVSDKILWIFYFVVSIMAQYRNPVLRGC